VTGVAPKISVEELILLLRGDEFSCGYVTVPLVFEICLRTQPVSLSTLYDVLYADVPLDDIDAETERVLRTAYELWSSHKRARSTSLVLRNKVA
jgi:hypothetical protein